MNAIGTVTVSGLDTPARPALRLVGGAGRAASSAIGGDQQDVWLSLTTASLVLGVSAGHLRRECARWLRQGLARKMAGQWEVHRRAHPRLNSTPGTPGSPGSPGTPGTLGSPTPATTALAPGHDLADPAAYSGGVRARLAAATAAQRERAAHRASALLDFRAWRAKPGVEVHRDFAGYARARRERGAPTYSLTTLYEMCQRCGATEDPEAVQAALLDIGRGGSRVGVAGQGGFASGGGASASGGGGGGGGVIGDDAWTLFASLWMTPEKRSAATCWRIVRQRALEHPGKPGWSWPTLRAVQLALKQRIAAQAAIMAREGLDAWRSRCQAPMTQHPDAWAVNERWDADHCRMDFFVRVPVSGGGGARPNKTAGWRAARPWITLWLDWRTRRVMGWVLSLTPNTHTVRLSLLRALAPQREERLIGAAPGFAWPASPGGPPRIAWLDNGKDFASRAIAGTTKQQRRRMASRCARLGGAFGFEPAEAFGLLAALGIECHFAQPYNHNGKSRVERFFAWMHQDFDRRFSSYCGSRPGLRDRDTLDEAVADVMSLPTLAEAEALLADWLLASNARVDHAIRDLTDLETGATLSPDAAYAAMLPTRRTLADPAALGLLREQFGPAVRVGKSGAPHTLSGQTLHYGEHCPLLHEYVGSDRRVRLAVDPADLSTARCYDAATMRMLGTLRLNRAFGQRVSREALRDGLAARREAQRAVRRTIDMAALGRDAVQAALHAQRRLDLAPGMTGAGADSGADSGAHAPLLVVRTPLDGQAALVGAVGGVVGGAVGGADDYEPADDVDDLIDDLGGYGHGDNGFDLAGADDDLLELIEVIDDPGDVPGAGAGLELIGDDTDEPAAEPAATEAYDVLEDLP